MQQACTKITGENYVTLIKDIEDFFKWLLLFTFIKNGFIRRLRIMETQMIK
jgi:hypothetical protein